MIGIRTSVCARVIGIAVAVQLSQQPGCLKQAKCQGPEGQGQCVSRTASFWRLQGRVCPCFFQLVVASGTPWLVAASPQSLPLGLHRLPQCLGNTSTFALLKRCLLLHLGPTQIIQSNLPTSRALVTSAKSLSFEVTFIGFGD